MYTIAVVPHEDTRHLQIQVDKNGRSFNHTEDFICEVERTMLVEGCEKIVIATSLDTLKNQAPLDINQFTTWFKRRGEKFTSISKDCYVKNNRLAISIGRSDVLLSNELDPYRSCGGDWWSRQHFEEEFIKRKFNLVKPTISFTADDVVMNFDTRTDASYWHDEELTDAMRSAAMLTGITKGYRAFFEQDVTQHQIEIQTLLNKAEDAFPDADVRFVSAIWDGKDMEVVGYRFVINGRTTPVAHSIGDETDSLVRVMEATCEKP